MTPIEIDVFHALGFAASRPLKSPAATGAKNTTDTGDPATWKDTWLLPSRLTVTGPVGWLFNRIVYVPAATGEIMNSWMTEANHNKALIWRGNVACNERV